MPSAVKTATAAPEPEPEGCPTVKKMVNYIAGLLDKQQSAAITTHINACDKCSERQREFREVIALTDGLRNLKFAAVAHELMKQKNLGDLPPGLLFGKVLKRPPDFPPGYWGGMPFTRPKRPKK